MAKSWGVGSGAVIIFLIASVSVLGLLSLRYITRPPPTGLVVLTHVAEMQTKWANEVALTSTSMAATNVQIMESLAAPTGLEPNDKLIATATAFAATAAAYSEAIVQTNTAVARNFGSTQTAVAQTLTALPPQPLATPTPILVTLTPGLYMPMAIGCSIVAMENTAETVEDEIEDKNGNLITVKYNGGRTIHYIYDESDNRIAIIDSIGEKNETCVYDDLKNLIMVTDHLNQTTKFQYDEAGNIIAVTDSSGKITFYYYDGNGKLIRSKVQN